jgi:hypothetical protein
MGMDGKVSNTAAPPFATKDGKPAATSGNGGGFDAHKNPNGSQPATGGRDFTQEMRTQSEAKNEQDVPAEEIPKGNGGIHMQADAGAVSGSGNLGGVEPLGRTASPFKNMK